MNLRRPTSCMALLIDVLGSVQCWHRRPRPRRRRRKWPSGLHRFNRWSNTQIRRRKKSSSARSSRKRKATSRPGSFATAQGEILRRFADTNSDNIVDQWCYYLDGLEVYRDIDSNFNEKADQYRWFHTAGSRWGIDKNEDKQDRRLANDLAARSGRAGGARAEDARPARFNLLLLTPAELSELGSASSGPNAWPRRSRRPARGFAKLAAEQKVVTPQSRSSISAAPGRRRFRPARRLDEGCDRLRQRDRAGANRRQARAGVPGHARAVGDTWKLIDLPASAPISRRPAHS